MKLNKTIKSLLVVSMVSFTAFVGTPTVKADNDYEVNEREYIAMCSSDNLSRSEIATCQDFNNYLKSKSSGIQSSIDDAQSLLDSTQDKINEVYNQINQLETQISEKQETIDYINTQIAGQEEQIQEKQDMLKDRLYEMQTYVNSNQMIDFILGATSFSDLFSRIDGVNELTASDKELIVSLNDAKKELEDTKQWAQDEQNALLASKQEQENKKAEMDELIQTYTAQIEAGEASLAESASIQSSLESAIQNSQLTLEQQQWISNGGNSNSDSSSDNSNSGTIADTSGIAGIAYSKVGSAYVYGATGPNAFDCSGFTSWVYAQVGINITRTTYSQVNQGYAVSAGDLQPGDLLFFNTGGYCSHVGIYAGNGVMIHAGTPATGVETTNFYSSYWQGCFLTARRIR